MEGALLVERANPLRRRPLSQERCKTERRLDVPLKTVGNSSRVVAVTALGPNVIERYGEGGGHEVQKIKRN